MDETIEQNIEARRSAFVNSYEITDANLKNDIEALFKKMNELGKGCKDVMEFEAKFATSPLSGEFTKLYTRMASTCEMVSLDKMFNNKEEKKDEKETEVPKESDVEIVKEDNLEPVRKVVNDDMKNEHSSTQPDDTEQVDKYR